MINEPNPDNQATQPHRLPLDQTQPHHSVVEDTQPGRKLGGPMRRLPNLRTMVAQIVLVALSVFVMLIAMYRIAPPPRTNILLMGIDARPKEGWMARSDSMMLVTVDPRRMYIGMLSIPRDLFVAIPGYADNRINTAHMLGEERGPGGGPVLAARTVEQDFGVPIQRTVRLKFDGFVRIIDAAGGVDINVPYRIVDSTYPTINYGTTTVVFEAGWQHMDGQQALAYARTRHADGDFNRAGRQQEVLTALMSKLSSPPNWVYWPAVLLTIDENVETNLTVWDAIAYAPVMMWVGPGGIDRQEIGGDMATGYRTQGGAAVLAPHWDLINPLIEEMFGD